MCGLLGGARATPENGSESVCPQDSKPLKRSAGKSFDGEDDNEDEVRAEGKKRKKNPV